MMYLIAWLIGGIMGVICMALVSVNREDEIYQTIYIKGYEKGYMDGKESKDVGA